MRHKISNIYTFGLNKHISVYQPEHRCSVNAAFYWNTFHCSTLVPLCRRSDTERLVEMTGGTYFCRWACGHSRQPGYLWLADRWYFSSLAAHSCRHSWTARWSQLCEETQEEHTCQEEHGGEFTAESPWCSSEPSQFIGSVVFLKPWFPRLPLLFTLLSVLIACVFSFGPWSRCQTRRRASGASDWKSVWYRVSKA